ncbi:Indolepyruvate ferredoxin oxidoreductase [Desulfarculus baarsii DSM 2075]|uniref:Indolepyruvate oxidoreductase subunit IorA n=1 Tax=Desulfarculus baarsii (strain ATCC 33931 / DSM 2075 / LMG 7858 / VKM B-1802 / 2st14) TaxID=644282 RepID=E1QFC0_DESB2|nr:thiamine pyrophosphate-dependent enzyme [Desulfarculus baarsii]ADK84256.1 Indolepyruvate ferredoxin oxidoreductase [Desulfarculus baarsii DSM 2075]
MPDLTKLAAGQTVLLQGNEAIARGALEAGVQFAAAYPGNPSSEILQCLADSAQSAGIHAEWSTNEKVALESAAAASFCGLRAMASMKQNGVNVAQDFICNLTISGVGTGGLVLITADDPSGISSTNEQDARFIARLACLPLLEPSTPDECRRMIKFAFELSEAIQNIVVFRSLSRLSHTRGNVAPGPLPGQKRAPHWRTGQNFITMPVMPKHQIMLDKLAKAGQIMAESPFNPYDGPARPELVIIASGSSWLYASEARQAMGLEDRVGLQKLGGTWPLPEALLLERLAASPAVLFAEEIDPIIEDQVMALYARHAAELGPKRFFGKASGHTPMIGELSPGRLAQAVGRILDLATPTVAPDYLERARQAAARLVPPREFGFCPGCPHRASFWSIKQVLAADGRDGLVSGDIGCYTLGALSTGYRRVNSVHCMGSGLGVGSGLGQLGPQGFDQPVLTVVGDSTFFHSGLPGLINARWNGADFLLCILDNAATAMTGFQPHPATGQTATGRPGGQISLESVLDGLGVPYRITDPYDLAATQQTIYDALLDKGGARALILRRACALVQNKRGGHPYVMSVDQSVCRGEECGCNRFCSRVFRCPGLIFDEAAGKARIDEVVCAGCGVCAQICPAGAIKAELKDQSRKEAAA